MDEVHEVALALLGKQVDEIIGGDAPGRNPFRHLSLMRSQERVYVAADVVEVMWVVVADMQVLTTVDINPVVDLLPRGHYEESALGQNRR